MDKEETVAADSPEAVTLVQKGRDYDRVRKKYDESKPVMEAMALLAKQMERPVSENLSMIRLNLKTQDGMSEDEARRAIAMEDREATLSEKESETAEQDRREKERQAQIAAFANKYPKLDAKEIPKEVWTQFNDGTPLIDAYEKYQSQKQISEKDRRISEMEAELSALKKNAENSTKSASSMKSAGNGAVERDAFLEGFGS